MTFNSVEPISLVDREIQPFIEFLLGAYPLFSGPLRPDLVTAMRQSDIAWLKPIQSTPVVVERMVPVPGAPPVRIYLINSNGVTKRPAVLHTHGGGLISGSALAAVADLQVQAEALDCVVVTVEYRLAPETTFPGALDDNYAALCWLHDHAEELGIDRSRIAIQGESAGGAHAAMLAIAVRDRGEFPICFLLLGQPMLDDRTGSSRQVPSHIGTYLWTRDLNVAGWTAFLGFEPREDLAFAAAVPARVEDVSGLPPTFIGVGAIDLFVEESIAFATRLIQAGVPTELQVLPGAMHSFERLAPETSLGRRYRLSLLNALARAFGRTELAVPPAPAAWGTPVDAVDEHQAP